MARMQPYRRPVKGRASRPARLLDTLRKEPVPFLVAGLLIALVLAILGGVHISVSGVHVNLR